MSQVLAGIAIAAASVGVPVAAAPAASAEADVTGCFSYSYEEGNATTTVYYHNRCENSRVLNITRKGDFCNDGISFAVDGNKKGNTVVRCGTIEDVWSNE